MLPDPTLCFITDSSLTEGRLSDEVLKEAIAGGTNMIQLRDHRLRAGPLLKLALRIRNLTKNKALFFVNDRVDIALLSKADGVQLSEQGLKPSDVRRITGNSLLVGRSVHSVAGAKAATLDGADFLIAGTIFKTQSHPSCEPAGVVMISEIRRVTELPILAIGGVGRCNARNVMERGANGVAVITAISQQAEPKLAATALMSELSK